MINIEFTNGKEPLEIEADTVAEAVQYAVKNRLDLRGADLFRANLRGADLRMANLFGANLREADLRWADLSYADLREANLRGADLFRADLRGADLFRADLRGANLRWADLRKADVDFSCWPLWCESLNVKIDKRIFCQLLYHTLRAGQSIDDPGVKRLFENPEVVNMANKFHRVDECGKIELKGSGNATLHN